MAKTAKTAKTAKAATPTPAIEFDPHADDAPAKLAEILAHARDPGHWTPTLNALHAAVGYVPLSLRALRLAAEAGLADSARHGLAALPPDAAFEIASAFFTNADRDTEVGRALVEAATFGLWEAGSVERWLPLLVSVVRGDAPIHTKRHALYFGGHLLHTTGRRDPAMVEAAVATLGQADADSAEAWISFFGDVADPRAVPFLVEALARDSDGSRALEVLRQQPPEVVAPVLRAWLPTHTIENACDRGLVADYAAELDVVVPDASKPAAAPTAELVARLATHGNVVGTKRALELGAPVGTIDSCPETPLHRLLFAWLGYLGDGTDANAVVEIVRLLVAHGADPNAKLAWKWMPAEDTEFAKPTTPLKMVETVLAEAGDRVTLDRNGREVAVADVAEVLAILQGAAKPRKGRAT